MHRQMNIAGGRNTTLGVGVGKESQRVPAMQALHLFSALFIWNTEKAERGLSSSQAEHEILPPKTK